MRGDRYFVDVSTKGQRRTATCDTLDEAIIKQAELREEIRVGKEAPAAKPGRKSAGTRSSWTLQRGLEKMLSLPKPEGWRGTSSEAMQTLNIESAMKFFGAKKPMGELTKEDIHAWLEDCAANGNADATLNRKLSALSKMLKTCKGYGGIDALPDLPRQRKEAEGRIRQISQKEEKAMLQWFRTMGDLDMEEAVQVLIDTGIRSGELRMIEEVDVQMETGVLLIYGSRQNGTKSGRARSVPMTARVKAIMQRRIEDDEAGEGQWLFPMSKTTLRHKWDRMRAHLKLAGDPDFVPHVCRHTCASRLVSKGVSIATVQQWLGHSSIQMTMRYAHLYPQDLMNAVKALEA